MLFNLANHKQQLMKNTIISRGGKSSVTLTLASYLEQTKLTCVKFYLMSKRSPSIDCDEVAAGFEEGTNGDEDDMEFDFPLESRNAKTLNSKRVERKLDKLREQQFLSEKCVSELAAAASVAVMVVESPAFPPGHLVQPERAEQRRKLIEEQDKSYSEFLADDKKKEGRKGKSKFQYHFNLKIYRVRTDQYFSINRDGSSRMMMMKQSKRNEK